MSIGHADGNAAVSTYMAIRVGTAAQAGEASGTDGAGTSEVCFAQLVHRSAGSARPFSCRYISMVSF